MWNLQYATNEPIYKTEIDSQAVQTCGCQGKEGREVGRRVGRRDWEFGVSRCKLLHIEWNGQTIRSYCMAQGTTFNILG